MTRDAGPALTAALAAYLGPLGQLHAQSRPWASATFAGARHRVSFTLPATAATERLVDGLTQVDLPLAGHFVADLELIRREADGAATRIEIAALTIAEA